ncbi:hypothetical protein GCK72_011421 [Caenorhabditis remanei]|uniref:Uncharacterized protein n=1 Tax=Caenorhabditis remanei TaxID=31234 RepID=A0A6A5H7R6_CAERE|nr:hypothetical protein GCK72_011421 [Caenorhabditis remanei]KAF1763155.1 hypothetical protein GCK72_011421 [Caenorhabditis remanei]
MNDGDVEDINASLTSLTPTPFISLVFLTDSMLYIYLYSDKWLTAYVQKDGIMFFDYKKVMGKDEERRKMDCDENLEKNMEEEMDEESSDSRWDP